MFITHDLGVIAELADKVVVMYKGKIVEQGNVWDIFTNPKLCMIFLKLFFQGVVEDFLLYISISNSFILVNISVFGFFLLNV